LNGQESVVCFQNGPPPKAQEAEILLNAQVQRTDKRSWFGHERFLTGERGRAIWSNLPPKAQPAVILSVEGLTRRIAQVKRTARATHDLDHGFSLPLEKSFVR
jgi:hypothetical protein